jgi:ATP-dependent Clp protease ATP-binding subunit ClpC
MECGPLESGEIGDRCGREGAEMFERFTDRARRILFLAQQQATLLHHNFIGTEHLLLGLLEEGQGIASKVLTSFDLTVESVTKRVREHHHGSASTSSSGSPPFSPRAKKALELSRRETLQLDQYYIGTEHILLGLIEEGTGTAVAVMTELGADPSDVRQRVIEALAESAAMPVDSPDAPLRGIGPH